MTWSDGLDDHTILGIWHACTPPRARGPDDLRRDMLASASHRAIHYGIGGEIHELTMITVGLRSGLRLGFIKSTGSGAEREVA